jgi:UDP-glucose 4-epimerase
MVTGAGGFIGSQLVEHFRSRGWRVKGLDRAGLSDSALAESLVGEQPDACVHCAGSASVPASMQDPLNDFRANVDLTAKLLDAIRKDSPATRVVLLSSAAVYGSPAELPVREAAAMAPVSPYGHHKFMAEQLFREYASVHRVPTSIARVFSAYGPGLRRQVLWDASRKLLDGRKLLMQGTGAESRDFIHVSDIARAVECILGSAAFEGEAYNVASGCETTVAELAHTLCEVLEMPPRVEFDGVVPAGNPLRWRANIERLQSLGFETRVSIAQGVAEYGAWARRDLQPV